MATNDIISSVMPTAIAWAKFFLIFFVVAIVIVIGVYLIIQKKKRKWNIEIHEQKADGKIHTVGKDVLEEKKLNMGTKTIYWLRRAKAECIPPPSGCVDRYKGKEEVDYLRIERDYIPCVKTATLDFHNPKTRNLFVKTYDIMLKRIRGIKTTFLDSEPVRDRFIYIPVQRSLCANINYSPIDYDMSMMAMNEIHNADEFYTGKYEFWKKYGAVIVFALTVVFLIIVVVMTYDYTSGVIQTMMGKADAFSLNLQNIASNVANGGAPTPAQ